MRSLRSLKLFLPLSLKLRSESCMLYLVSTILNFFLKMKSMERSYQEVNRPGLGGDSVRQEYFNFCLVILIWF